jgi:hypothetical protein
VTKIDPIESKLKNKNYKGHGKSCLRMENHANGMPYLHDVAMPFAWFSILRHDLLWPLNFLSFSLLSMGSILVAQYSNFLYLKKKLDALPMIVFSSSNFIPIKS